MAGILAIVGSTSTGGPGMTARAEDLIRHVIEQHHPDAVVSGGAPGIDTMAETIAQEEYELPVIVCKPARKAWWAFKQRNQLIANICTSLVRIKHPDSKTYGSGWTRDRAEEQGKPTEEYSL